MWGRNFLIFVISLLSIGDESVYCQETTVRVKLKILLHGCYSTTEGQMSVNLRAGNYLSLTSPYCEDPRSVTSIPTDISDWVLVELYTSVDGAPVASHSTFLRRDGYIVADDGTTNIIVTALPGNYFVAVIHRNHITVMTNSAVALNSDSAILYDFTTNIDKCYGTNGMVEIEPGVWGMWAGDINHDGMTTTKDYAIWYHANRANLNGYQSSDVNRDGLVNSQDYSIWLSNAQKDATSPFHRVGNDPVICLSIDSLDFGTVDVGITSEMILTIANTGTTTLQISTISTTNSAFTIIGSTSFNIAASAYQEITVRFTPTSAASYNATLHINNNSAESVKNVPLTGSGCNGLVAYYPFNGNANDESGNSYNGVVYGATLTNDRFGNQNHAYRFDGTDDYIDCGDILNDLNVPITVTAWINIQAYTKSSSLPIFFTDLEPIINVTSNYYGLSFYGANMAPNGMDYLDVPKLGIRYGDGTSHGMQARRTRESDLNLVLNQWVHVAAVVRGAQDMELYINGIKVGGLYSGSGGNMAHNNWHALIGTYFYGNIDELCVFSRSLNESEILQLFNSNN